MARAMTQFERNDAGDWVPVGVWLATAKRVQARMLPGSAPRDAFMRYVISDAQRPKRPFSTEKLGWPDWIEWAAWSLSDGHIRLMTEVTPTVTLDQLYAREVLGEATPSPLYDPKHQPTAEVPDLKGRELRGGLGAPNLSRRVAEAEADLREYSDDQARDEQGRWTAGGGGSAWPAPDTSKSGIEDATSAWTGTHFADVREYVRTGSVREGMSEKDDPIHGISDQRAAQSASTLTAAIAAGPVAPDLYRGMNVDDAAYEHFTSMEAGDRVDMGLTSWSADEAKATEFAGRTQWTGSDEDGHETSHPVIIRTSGARGFDMARYSFYPDEKEWLSDGRFTVQTVTRDHSGNLVLDLHQSAVFDTPAGMEGKP